MKGKAKQRLAKEEGKVKKKYHRHTHAVAMEGKGIKATRTIVLITVGNSRRSTGGPNPGQ